MEHDIKLTNDMKNFLKRNMNYEMKIFLCVLSVSFFLTTN